MNIIELTTHIFQKAELYMGPRRKEKEIPYTLMDSKYDNNNSESLFSEFI